MSLKDMMEPVKVVSVSTILPATYTPSSPVAQRIDLTPWDLQHIKFGPVQYGLVFGSNLTLESVQRLKDSLARTLDFFYPIAGRLCSIENESKDSTLFYIECNNAGVEFTHAVSNDVTMGDLLQHVYNPSIMKLLYAESAFVCGSKHFLVVRVTELKNGGFFLGCSMSHFFVDGSSFWHFINSWSEICRGSDSISDPPVLERLYPGKAEIWLPNQLLIPQPSCENLSIYKEKIFIFPKEKIALLKQKAIQESGNHKISSLQALLAFVWTLTSRYRQVSDDENVMLGMAIGVRTRTEPPMSPFYFGNAICPNRAFMKIEDLRAEGALGRAASKVHHLVNSCSGDSVKDFIKSWIEKPNIFHGGKIVMATRIVVSSSPRFDVYGNDFGWGRPVAVRSNGVSKPEGRVKLFQGPEDGSVHVEICLPEEALDHLEKDSEFLDGIKARVTLRPTD